MNALWEIVQTRLVRRGVAGQELQGRRVRAGGRRHGPAGDHDSAGHPDRSRAEIVKFLKDKKLKKVQAAIQADQVRVSSPSKDELQDAMRALREHDFGVALQFGNYR